MVSRATTFLPRGWKPRSRIISRGSSSSVRKASSAVIQRARLTNSVSEYASIGCPLGTGGRGPERCLPAGVSLDRAASYMVCRRAACWCSEALRIVQLIAGEGQVTVVGDPHGIVMAEHLTRRQGRPDPCQQALFPSRDTAGTQGPTARSWRAFWLTGI